MVQKFILVKNHPFYGTITMHLYISIVFINLVTFGSLYADKTRKKISEVVDMRAVTDFIELKDLYQELHEKDKKIYPSEPSNKKRKARIKKKLCKKIFNSTFYDMQEEDWLHPNDEDNRQKLEKLFPHTFHHVFEQASPLHQWLKKEDRIYVNDYRHLPIHLADDSMQRKEHLFSCFTMERGTGNISHYLVSKEYNVTEGMIDAFPMAARFVFGLDEWNRISLIAMSEESAMGHPMVDKTNTVELYYLGFRNHTNDIEPSEDDMDEDPVCKLSLSYKLRVCASVFAAKIFRTTKIKFRPLFTNVEKNCAVREVSFLAEISKNRRLLMHIMNRDLKRNHTYNELMFGCTVTNVATSPHQELLYYVSRGDRPHTVFLYTQKFSNKKLYVVNYMKNVSVVDARSDGREAAAQESGTYSMTSRTAMTKDNSGDDIHKYSRR